MIWPTVFFGDFYIVLWIEGWPKKVNIVNFWPCVFFFSSQFVLWVSEMNIPILNGDYCPWLTLDILTLDFPRVPWKATDLELPIVQFGSHLQYAFDINLWRGLVVIPLPKFARFCRNPDCKASLKAPKSLDEIQILNDLCLSVWV